MKQYYLNLIFIIALAAFLGSLFFSEIKEFPPCDLCWYQRVLMYPIGIIAFFAIIFHDNKAYRYIFPMSLMGMSIAIYNYLLQKTDWFVKLETCSIDNPCNEIVINYLGFITIPLMSFVAFGAINLIISLYLWQTRRK
jgi:disulfide bond formation protein DsbB